MASVEYTPKRRTWLRDVLIGVAAGLGADLVRTCVENAARLLG
ncbi:MULTISPECIES: DUF6408 family protein [unclassified Streptomyces]